MCLQWPSGQLGLAGQEWPWLGVSPSRRLSQACHKVTQPVPRETEAPEASAQSRLAQRPPLSRPAPQGQLDSRCRERGPTLLLGGVQSGKHTRRQGEAWPFLENPPQPPGLQTAVPRAVLLMPKVQDPFHWPVCLSVMRWAISLLGWTDWWINGQELFWETVLKCYRNN